MSAQILWNLFGHALYQRLWFLNRGTGVVLVSVRTTSMVLGIAASRGRAGRRLPAFVTQTLHRNLSLLGLALLLVHIATAVLDEYVDIRWWNAVVPWGSSYESLWVALGALATDLMLALALLTALRNHVGQRTWRGGHRAAYPPWLVGHAHGHEMQRLDFNHCFPPSGASHRARR